MSSTMTIPAEPITEPAQNVSVTGLTAAEDDPGHTPGTPEGSDAPESRGAANTEAAKWRTRLRDAECERDQLAGRVEVLQRAEILRAAGDLAEPNDLFTLGGITLEDLLDEDRNVDAEKVTEAVAALLDSRPGLHKNARHPAQQRYRQYGQSAGTYIGGGSGVTWGDALRGGR